MKRLLPILFLSVFCLSGLRIFAQSSFSSYGTQTLFEGLHNPAVGSLVSSYCSTFETNFLVPGVNGAAQLYGPADTLLRNAIRYNSKTIYNMESLENPNAMNYADLGGNVQWIAAKILLDSHKGKELFFDVSTKGYGTAQLTNAAISSANPNNLETGTYNDQYITNSFAAAYTQLAVGYRQKISDNIALGAKIGYVSGLAYSQVQITQTTMTLAPLPNSPDELGVTYSMHGQYSTLGIPDERTAGYYMPNGYNPGFTMSLGSQFKLSDTWGATLAVKDIGCIWWQKGNRIQYYDGQNYLENEPLNSFDTDKITDLFSNGVNTKTDAKFRKPLPASVEGGVSGILTHYLKTSFAFYIPFMDLQQSYTLITDFHTKGYHLRVQPQFNTNTGLTNNSSPNTVGFQLGLNFMIKRPKYDLILGTDDIIGFVGNVGPKPHYHAPANISFNFGMVFRLGNCYYTQNSGYIPNSHSGYDRGYKRKVYRTEGY